MRRLRNLPQRLRHTIRRERNDESRRLSATWVLRGFLLIHRVITVAGVPAAQERSETRGSTLILPDADALPRVRSREQMMDGCPMGIRTRNRQRHLGCSDSNRLQNSPDRAHVATSNFISSQPVVRAIARDLQAMEVVDDHHRECRINHWSRDQQRDIWRVRVRREIWHQSLRRRIAA